MEKLFSSKSLTDRQLNDFKAFTTPWSFSLAHSKIVSSIIQQSVAAHISQLRFNFESKQETSANQRKFPDDEKLFWSFQLEKF